jgi:hypothetical protein
VAIAAALAGAALLACGTATANPRAAQDMGGAMTPDADLDVWLRRLVGKYNVEGMVQADVCGDLPPDPATADEVEFPPEPLCQPIKGKGDCVGVGDGPGVQCMFNVTWQDMYRVAVKEGAVTTPPGGESYLDPAMALFGLDPRINAFSYLLVDHKSLPEGDHGYIKGNRATFRTICVNGPVVIRAAGSRGAICYRTVRLDARPDANVVHWSMDIEILEEGGDLKLYTRFEMTLRRDSAVRAIDAPYVPKVKQ